MATVTLLTPGSNYTTGVKSVSTAHGGTAGSITVGTVSPVLTVNVDNLQMYFGPDLLDINNSETISRPLLISGPSPQAVTTVQGLQATPVLTILGATGGATTNIAGIAGDAADETVVTGAGGSATGSTSATGGAGGDVYILNGAGGAASGAGTNIGGKGGTWRLSGGTGGAASGGGTNTGGTGGDLILTAGSAGAGTSGNAGNAYVILGTATGAGTLSSFLLQTAALSNILSINSLGQGQLTGNLGINQAANNSYDIITANQVLFNGVIKGLNGSYITGPTTQGGGGWSTTSFGVTTVSNTAQTINLPISPTSVTGVMFVRLTVAVRNESGTGNMATFTRYLTIYTNGSANAVLWAQVTPWADQQVIVNGTNPRGHLFTINNVSPITMTFNPVGAGTPGTNTTSVWNITMEYSQSI